MEDKERFCGILKATGRTGIDRALAGLEELGFFAAPASTRFHGSEPGGGGLLKHSLNVYDPARVLREVVVKMCPAIEPKVPVESIAITALLHDVCKAEVSDAFALGECVPFGFRLREIFAAVEFGFGGGVCHILSVAKIRDCRD